MAEKVTAGPITSANGVREAVCIHTKKIFSSCKDKDCIEDLTFYPTATAQSVIDASQSIRGGRVELLHVGVDVEPVSFNRGFFTVDMRFYYRVILQAVNNGMRATEIEGLATFDKRVMLFGGESRAKVFSSYPVPGGADYPIDLTANLPTAVVSAVDPLLLCARIVDCSCGNCCDCTAVTACPRALPRPSTSPFSSSRRPGACASPSDSSPSCGSSAARSCSFQCSTTASRAAAASRSAAFRAAPATIPARCSRASASRWTISSPPASRRAARTRRRTAAAAAANKSYEREAAGAPAAFFFIRIFSGEQA